MSLTATPRARRGPRKGEKVVIPELAMFYVVYYPETWTLKVGRAWRMHRVNDHEAAGAELLWMWAKTPASWESGALAVMHEWYPPRFTSKAEAADILPHGGKGWTECFHVPPEYVDLAVDMIIHEGIRRYE